MNKNAVITVLLMVVTFAFGFIAGRATDATPQAFVEATTEVGESIVPGNNDTQGQNANAQTTQGGGTTVNTSSLPESQRQMLEALGIDADNITITAEMVACAEAKLGAARVEEIKNGATPSFTEGATLIACYR